MLRLERKEKCLVRVGSMVTAEKLGGVHFGSGGSDESSDGMVGFTKILSSISECPFDSESDKSCPGF